MPDVMIAGPDQGLNGLLPVRLLSPREAANGSYNLLYEKGKLSPAPGAALYNMTSALDSGNPVLHAWACRIGSTDYVLAATTEKLFRYDIINDEWDDITQSGVTMDSDIDHPVSWVVITHDDTAVYFNDDAAQANAYEHVVVSDGGLSDIQRWAGEGESDFADVSGSTGYSGAGPHRALQVGTAQNRLILISPLEYDTSSKVWIENDDRVRWPQIGKLESWSGSGSGAVNLRDTGGKNVWSAPLGTEYYVYQTNSIWNLRYVGGTSIFDPRPMIRNLGLLSYHLLVVQGNIHYFMASDYNIYAYFGGTQKLAIGDKIKDDLYANLYQDQLARCWMAMDVKGEWLWVFIVTTGNSYATKAYGYNVRDRVWTHLDWSDKFTGTTGITVASVVGATTSTGGDTYAQALATLSPYEISDAGDATQRYGDVLCDSSRTLTTEVTNSTWCAGGTYLTDATGAFLTDMTIGDIMLVEDGSEWTNCRYGDHFYTIKDLSNTYIELWERDPSLGVSDTTAVPAAIPFSVWTDTGPSYAENLSVLTTKSVVAVGSSDGYIYYLDPSLAGDINGTTVGHRHLTPVFDGGTPGRQKRWPGLRITAKKPETTKDGQLLVYYRTSGFDGTDGFTRIDATWSLDSTYATKEFFINRTSSAIQFALMDASGSTFEVAEMVILAPDLQENR